MERVCKNCRLFDGPTSTCKVRLIVGGRVFRDVPVSPSDGCLWEEMGVADQIKEVRFRVVDPKTGEPTTGQGKVLIEYPEGFFGS